MYFFFINCPLIKPCKELHAYLEHIRQERLCTAQVISNYIFLCQRAEGEIRIDKYELKDIDRLKDRQKGIYIYLYIYI